MTDLIHRDDATKALSYAGKCSKVCIEAIKRITPVEKNVWMLTSEQDPPCGVPLIVTVQAKWKEWREVLAPVYYVYNMSLAKFVFFDLLESSVIGPTEVKVVAWMRMPDACEAPVIWGEKDNGGVF